MHTLWAKIGGVSIFLKNWFQIDENDLNLRVDKCIFSKSTPRQQYTNQQPSTSNAYLSTPMHTLWAKISWVSIYLKKRFQIDASDLNLKVAKCIFSKSTPHQQYTRQHPSTSKAYLSTPMHTLWAKIGWVSIFLKNWFQFDANDLNLRVAKCIFSKSTPRQQYTRQYPSNSNSNLSTPMHPLWAKISWVSIFLKKRFQIDASDLNLKVAKYIFSKFTPHQHYTWQHPSTSNAYLSPPMHTLWAKIGWVSIFLKNWFQFDANDLNLRVAKCIFSKSTPRQQYTRQYPSNSNSNLSTPMHPLWAKITWVSIFLKKRFQIDASDLNLKVAKCIFSKFTPHQHYTWQHPSTSNAYLSPTMHTLWAKIGWVSIYLKKRFQIDASDLNLKVAKCIFSKFTPHQHYTWQHPSTSNAYLSPPMHTLWAKIGWVSIFSRNRFQIDANDLNLRVAKCIFSISTPHQQYTRQQPLTSNAYLSTSTHTLWAKISWVSIYLKKRFQIDASDLNLKVAKCIFSKFTPRQHYTWQHPSTSNAYLSPPMHTLWAKIGWVSIFLKNWFQFDANDLNLRVAKCIFSKSTPRQQYTRQYPSNSNSNLSTPMHPLWAKISWVSIFLKKRFQIDASDLNLKVAKCIFSKFTPHQHYTWQHPSTSNAYLSTPIHTLWAKISWVSIFLKKRFQIDASDLNLKVAKCIFSKSTPHQQYTRQHPSTSNAYLSPPMHTLWAKIGWVSIYLKKRKLTQVTSICQHIFKKEIPNWRKWPQFESCQMYIFKIYSSSTIHQATPFNLKSIFVHSHAHPLSKNWLSQHIF